MSALQNIKTISNLTQPLGDKYESKFTPQPTINKQSLQNVIPTTKPLRPQFHFSQSPKHAHTHTNVFPLVPLEQSQTFPYIPNQQNTNSPSQSSHVFKLQSIPMCQSEYQWFSSAENHEKTNKKKNMKRQVQQKSENKVYMFVKSINMMENTLMKVISHYKMYFMYKLNNYYPNHQYSQNENKNNNRTKSANNIIKTNNVINQTSMNSAKCGNNQLLNQKECSKNEDQVSQQKVQQSFESQLAVSPPSTKFPNKQILMVQQPQTYQFRQSNQVQIPHLQTYQYAQHYSQPKQKHIQFITSTLQTQNHKFSPQTQPHQHQHQEQLKTQPFYPYYQIVQQTNLQHNNRASSPFINTREKERQAVKLSNKRLLINSPSPQTKVYFQYQLQSPKQTISRPLSQPCLVRPTSSLPQIATITKMNRPQSYVPNKYDSLSKNNGNRFSSMMKSNRQNVRNQYYITNQAQEKGMERCELKICKSNPNFYIPYSNHDLTPKAHRIQASNQFKIKAKPQSRLYHNPWEQYAQLDQTIINKLNTEIPSSCSHQLKNRKQQYQACLSYEHPMYYQQINRREQRGSYDNRQKDNKKHPIYMEYRDNIHEKIKAAQRQKLTVVTKSMKHCKP